MKKLFFIICILLFASPVLATDYYISPSPAGSDSNPCSFESPCLTMGHVDSMLSAGDTLYARGGNYTSDYSDQFVTSNAGTSISNRITFRNYPGETPIFYSRGKLVSESYDYNVIVIKHNWWLVDGIQIKLNVTGSPGYNGIGIDADYVEVKNCLVDGSSYEFASTGCTGGGAAENRYLLLDTIRIESGADYNYVHDNILSHAGCCSGGANSGMILNLFGNNNRIGNNTVSYGGHDVFAISNATAVNNEFIDNTGTFTQGYFVANSNDPASGKNIIHNNKISGTDWDLAYGKIALYTKADQYIYRYNIVTGGSSSERSGSKGAGIGLGGDCDNTRIYNNTVYDMPGKGLKIEVNAVDKTGNLFLNNLIAKVIQRSSPDWWEQLVQCADYNYDCFSGSRFGTFSNNFFMAHDYPGGSWQNDASDAVVTIMSPDYTWHSVSYMESNYSGWESNQINSFSECDGQGDPKLADPINGDFSLQSGSCLIDAGKWLTAATNSGSGSNTLTTDGGFFWCSTWTDIWGVPSGQTRCDQIVINSTQSGLIYPTITAINGNTLTLDTNYSWTSGDEVTLYKSFSDSSTVLFSGSAPDIGAYEYQEQEISPSATTGFSGGTISGTLK